METSQERIESRTRSRSRKGLWMGLALMLGAGALAVGVPMAQAHDFGGGPGGAGMHGGGPGGHFGFRVQRLLEKVNASDSQKTQVKAIWDGLAPQLKAAHQQHGELHKQIAQAMAAPTIDPARIEKLRQQSVQAMDQTSKLITQGMVQTAQVLTPDQRKQALAEIEKHRGEHHRGGPGGPDGADDIGGP